MRPGGRSAVLRADRPVTARAERPVSAWAERQAGRRAARPEIVMTHDYPPLTGGGLALGVRELAGLLQAGHDARVRILSSRLADPAADDRQRPRAG